MLDPGCKDHLLNDNVPKGLVIPVDMMCVEDNKSDEKLDETVAVSVIVYRATLQASPSPNAMEYQEPQPTDKESVGFDNMLDPRSKDHLLNDNVPKGLVKLIDTMSGEDNTFDDKLDETVAGGVIIDRAMLQASPPPNAMEYQEPHLTSKVDATVFVIQDFSRPPNSYNRKVTLPPYFDNIFHLPIKTTYIFPLSKTGHSVDRDFWLTLLGCSNKAIADPYFYAFVMRGDVPFWPANGVKYPVPWTEIDREIFITPYNYSAWLLVLWQKNKYNHTMDK
nr:hypothetical protein [Tanacetum cinerariifolium]